jgi:hypothetical protein
MEKKTALILFYPQAAQEGNPRCFDVIFNHTHLPLQPGIEVRGFLTWEHNGKMQQALNKPEQSITNITWGFAVNYARKWLQRGLLTKEAEEEAKAFFHSTDEEPKQKVRRA